MRNLLILVLGAVVVWLLIERSQTTEKLTVAEKENGQLHKKLEAAEQQLVDAGVRRVPAQTPGSTAKPNPNSPQNTWLDAHIDKGARALEPAGKNKR